MPFKPGHPKFGGRKKGTPNKISLFEIRLKERGFDLIEEALTIYTLLERPSEKANMLMKMMEFVYPKVRVVDNLSPDTLAQLVKEYLDETNEAKAS